MIEIFRGNSIITVIARILSILFFVSPVESVMEPSLSRIPTY